MKSNRRGGLGRLVVWIGRKRRIEWKDIESVEVLMYDLYTLAARGSGHQLLRNKVREPLTEAIFSYRGESQPKLSTGHVLTGEDKVRSRPSRVTF